jgi:serine/threonine protein kinase
VAGRLGRYRLIRQLAVGGMAEVYLAVAEGLSGFEKRVVVKRLLPQHARNPELLAMFLDEARLCAGMRHPHIAEVYDVGEDGGDYFFAMEHVTGGDLRSLLDHGGALPPGDALAIAAAVAEGLHCAHEHRDEQGRQLAIVHRDVSPSNVLVSVGGEVKLIDFGVAKWAAQRTETRHGVLKGKCAYMSPEQCRAEPLDRRSDVFALGVLIYELTTGRRPFEGANDFEIMTAVVRGGAAPPSSVAPDYPPALDALVMSALAARREDRPATALALAEALKAFGLPANISALVRERLVPETTPAPVTVDRTLTDLSASEPGPAPVSPGEAPTVAAVRPAPRPRRWLMAAGLALGAGVAIAAFALGGPHPGEAPRRAIAPAPPIAHQRELPPVPRPAAPEPITPPARPRVRKRATPPPAPAPSPTPAIKVWDPDSPVPP